MNNDVDVDYEEAKEPKSSSGWLKMLKGYDKAIGTNYNERCDNIDKQYSSMERLSSGIRDREFQIFWANIQVLGPSVYARPPVPVVTPRFKDQKQLPRIASELLERSVISTFDAEDIDSGLRIIRDDLIISARGVNWLRYETASDSANLSERVRFDNINRKDFAHDPARIWSEVDWVARRAWLTKKEMRARFYSKSKDAYQDAAYTRRKDDDDVNDVTEKAGVWELWCKSKNKVVWVNEAVDKVLDEGEPHLDLEGFFPCPRPVYSTVQRNTLIPIPDFMYYKDQIEEINELTARISSLTESLKLRGFYPSGSGEIGDAIESAMQTTDNRQILIGVADWNSLGGGNAKDMVLWLPLDMVAKTIADLLNLRRQLIDDVYQITGLSDIMRGSTVASETLGAQQLKSQYGSVRIKDRQNELIRIARDMTRISAEIMAENFQQKTLMDMSQMELPLQADIDKQINEITTELEAAQQDPQLQQLAQQNPDKAKEIIEQANQRIEQLSETITAEKVVAFLRDERMRPFVLDIETDSTIAPDENAQKQRATEFITAVGGFMQQVVPLVQQVPDIAPLSAEMLKFVGNQFRAGRELQIVIEEFADKIKQAASQPKPEQPNPDAIKAQSEAKKLEADAAATMQETESKAQSDQIEAQKKQQQIQADAALNQIEVENKKALAIIQSQIAQDKLIAQEQKHQQDMDIGALQIEKLKAELAKAGIEIEKEVIDVNTDHIS